MHRAASEPTLLPAAWTAVPRHATRGELLRARAAERAPDASYDLDGDGSVSAQDMFIAARFDADGDGKLNASERAAAERALQAGLRARIGRRGSDCAPRILSDEQIKVEREQGWLRPPPAKAEPAPHVALLRRRRAEHVEALERTRAAWLAAASEAKREEAKQPSQRAPSPEPASPPSPPPRATAHCASELAEKRVQEARQIGAAFIEREGELVQRRLGVPSESPISPAPPSPPACRSAAALKRARSQAAVQEASAQLSLAELRRLRGRHLWSREARPFFADPTAAARFFTELYEPERLPEAPGVRERLALLKRQREGVAAPLSKAPAPRLDAGVPQRPKRTGFTDAIFTHEGLDCFLRKTERGRAILARKQAEAAAEAAQREQRSSQINDPLFSSFARDLVFREPIYGRKGDFLPLAPSASSPSLPSRRAAVATRQRAGARRLLPQPH